MMMKFLSISHFTSRSKIFSSLFWIKKPPEAVLEHVIFITSYRGRVRVPTSPTWHAPRHPSLWNMYGQIFLIYFLCPPVQ